MTSDFKISQPIQAKLNCSVIENNKMFFSPDGISLSCFAQVALGTPLTIVAN
ncbi:MAG: hypothetical protein O4808_22180 [Trichodesmium sp. St17_bin3_1_1]|nr:hypothetical protein [Trichodesmium sp. St18_bin1]MDE5109651.1 hypothetical protein [Trichodesmium sp. St17_bin3_1_1]MDE5120824.1 hypothetical protein [Trichodesmium sp. St19_bin1]